MGTALRILSVAPMLVTLLCSFARSQDQSALESIKGSEIVHHIKFLASEEMRGRETFTREHMIAARYIANAFELYGLKRPPNYPDYYQRIPSKLLSVGTPNAFATRESNYIEGEDFRAAAVGSGTLDAEVMFVGYGVTREGYDSYAGVNVRNKIVMVFEGNFPGKGGSFPSLPQLLVGNAIQHGASGMIFVRGSSPKNKKWEIGSELSKASLISPIVMAKKMKILDWNETTWKQWSHFPMVYVSMEVANDLLGRSKRTIGELKEEIDRLGKSHSFSLQQNVSLSIHVYESQQSTVNVVGMIEGTDPVLREEVIIVGAHYDHLSISSESGETLYGADDNASGIAALLEIAEAFSFCDAKPKRSILFIAFTGEEKSLIGSQYYIDHPVVASEKTTAMLNLDMIGRNDSTEIIVASQGQIKGFSPFLHEAAHKVGIVVRESEDISGSDHLAFSFQSIPVIFFFDGGGEFGHSPNDTWVQLSRYKMEQVARLCFLAIDRKARQ